MSHYTLRDAEVKYDYGSPTVSGKGSDGYYQTLEFGVDSLPEISTWKVGEEYTIILKVREKRHELVKSDDNKVKEKASFEIIEVGNYNDDLASYREKVKDKLK